MNAGTLRERVAFDAPTQTPDGRGGQTRGWTETYDGAAEFRYERGREAMQAGAVTGSASFKIKVRSCEATRALTTAHRMRDVRRGLAFNVREVDAITDRAFVWVVVEAGVAV